MNKKDIVPIALLILLIPLWLYIDRTFIAPKFPAKVPVVQPKEQSETKAGDVAEEKGTASGVVAIEKTAEVKPEKPKPVVKKPAAPEQVAVLKNDQMRVELSSWGGGIKRVTLSKYKLENTDDSPPVSLVFSNAPALMYRGLEGVGATDSLTIKELEKGRKVQLTTLLDNGMVFERTITLGTNYLLAVKDRFVAPDKPIVLPKHQIVTGYMKNPAGMKAMRGTNILGVDSYTPKGEVNYWGRKLDKYLYGKGDSKPLSIEAVPAEMVGVKVAWVSAKNKFFTQVLRPSKPIATMAVLASRDPKEEAVVTVDVAALLQFDAQTIEPNTTYEMDYTYYVGPKKYALLKAAGYKMEKVMEFETIGWWSWMNGLMEPVRKALLWTLNFFHSFLGNYGVAIILLTVLVRILFWPLTHKSTEKMAIHAEQMKAVQPQIKALNERYKNDKRRLQQETMNLYKKEGVNPMGAMGGCLPMFVQIPVFFALYSVLRNAIELRFAGFLWIHDLSVPENLFAGHIPVIGSLNILPIFMSLSMIFQQKLTPQMATTPEQQQQQKMMMYMMPVMMLFFFYSMPSGLVLYWTTSNLLAILQTVLRNRKKKQQAAHA